MDNQDNRDSQNDQPFTPTEEPKAYAYTPTPPEASPQSITAPPTTTPANIGKPSSKKLLYLLIGSIITIFIAAGVLWYFVLYSKKDSADATENQNANTSEHTDEKATFDQPDQLIYYRGNGGSTPHTLYARSIASADETRVMTFPAKTYIGNTTIRDNQVAFATTPGNGSTDDETAIYYSSDSGKTYKKVYSVSDSIKEAGVLGPQVTSLTFSTDGKTLLAGVLQSYKSATAERTTGLSKKNEVTEISLEGDHSTKTLFTSTTPGILLKGYDRGKQKVIYLASGCYNCEPFYSDIFSYDIAAATQDTLYHSKSLTGSTEIDKDFTKVLVLNPEGLHADSGAPYSLFTVDIATKAKETITTLDGERIRQAGYTPEGNPYFATNTKVQELANGKLTTLFEFTGSKNDAFGIPWILFAGDKGVVANAVTSIEDDKRETAKFSVLFSKEGDTKATEIIKNGSINGEITLIGVTRR